MKQEPRAAIVDIRVPFSTARQGWTKRLQVNGWNSALNKSYAAAVVTELRANAEEFSDVRIKAVRIGGGDALHIGGENVWSIVHALKECYCFDDDVSVSARCSMSDFSGASMPYFKRSGVVRFDLEMLSLSPMAFNCVNNTDTLSLYPVVCNEFLHSYANDSLGVVILLGCPNVSDTEVRRSILEVRHHNVSRVILEPYSGANASDESVNSQECSSGRLLSELGFVEYAPRHFARPGREDPFVVAKESGTDLLGFGLGARTVFGGATCVNTSDLETYLQFSGDFTRITEDAFRLNDGVSLF